jgi:hypothetical protein
MEQWNERKYSIHHNNPVYDREAMALKNEILYAKGEPSPEANALHLAKLCMRDARTAANLGHTPPKFRTSSDGPLCSNPYASLFPGYHPRGQDYSNYNREEKKCRQSHKSQSPYEINKSRFEERYSAEQKWDNFDEGSGIADDTREEMSDSDRIAQYRRGEPRGGG